jgi:chaperonin GroEL
MTAELSDVHVLVTDKDFSLNKDIFGLLDEINRHNIKQLLLICNSLSGEILRTIIANRMKGLFYCVAVEKPYDVNLLDDISVITGANTIKTEAIPGDLTKEHFSYLGKADKVIVDKDSTLIIGGKGSKESVEERITLVKSEIKKAEGPYEIEKLKERLAKLSGGIVILKVGAATESEMKYLKDKVDDAVSATKAAMEEGIVVGGGKTLFNISLANVESDGDEVVKMACRQPMNQIITNAGIDIKEITLGENDVFNALTGKVTSTPIEDGIIDPAKVERCALKNATSLASIVLTGHASIVSIPEKKNVV